MSAPAGRLAKRRSAALDFLLGTPLDVVVIGGGIAGVGVARDAAMRGLRVGLVEQEDFAFGTSSRSSRLLHGGLRYLAQGRVGLVREASVEKDTLHRIAPHLAEPLAFVFPTYRGTEWPLWQLRIGVKVYDLLCPDHGYGRSHGLSRAETLARVPGLKPHRLTGAVRYFDGLTNDARLVLDTLRSATRHGATALNYVRFRDAEPVGAGWRCRVEDRLSGLSHTLEARSVVNATGPWAQGLPRSQVRLRLTKGVHLVTDRARLPTSEAVVLAEGKRILFVIPWGQRIIVGTTDTDYDGAPEEVGVEANDIAYLLNTVNEFFPQAALKEQDIISTWAGLRPLLADPQGAPSDLSRSHQIHTPEPGWWDVAGGKLTTYRLMAEQTVDQMAKFLGGLRRGARPVRPCRTDAEPLLPEGQIKFSGVLPPPLSRAAVQHYCEEEWGVHLDDVLFRRSGWAQYHADREGMAAQVGAWMAETLGWTPAELAAEITRFERAAAWRPHS
jgi:glycerol-3-phosphate dehydrogenase